MKDGQGVFDLLALGSIPFFGVVAQWVAWRLRVPSIVVLLLFGILLGPVFGFIKPDDLLGPVFFPIVSLSVAFILFEGGLSLKLSDLKEVGKPVRNLVTIGILVSWVLSTIASKYILGFPWEYSVLFGSVLVVTGPTVIIPLLRFVKIKKDLASILRWESIVMDPIAAILAVLTYEVVFTHFHGDKLSVILNTLGITILVGFVFGLFGAYSLVVLFRRAWVPDYLQEAFTFVWVIIVFVLSNYIQIDSGLFTVTIMGILLANQQYVRVRHIVDFKEHLTILILGALFIILAARLSLNDILNQLNWSTCLFVLFIMFVARPVSVFVASIGTRLKWNESLFIGSLSPRGIVAAAISSIFAIRLGELGVPGADKMVSYTFLVIIVSVIFSSVFGRFFARYFKVVSVEEMGVVVVGAHDWARDIVLCLKRAGVNVFLVDSNRENLLEAKRMGIPIQHGNIMSWKIHEEIELGNYNFMVLMTSSDEVNLLATIEYQYVFGRKGIYSLCSELRSFRRTKGALDESRAKLLFGRGITYSHIAARILAGGTIQSVRFDREMGFDEWMVDYKRNLLLFHVSDRGKLVVFQEDTAVDVFPGDTLVFLG